MYIEVSQLKQQGFKVAAIARKLDISRNTVYKYLEMDLGEAAEWLNSIRTRSKKLDPYRDRIVSWLREHPDLSSAQIEDWLKEHDPTINIGGSTVRCYVSELRDFYHIPKELRYRLYEAVEELPMGQQVQVDWGEITVKTLEKKEVKLYFIAFVLSHSRYKYVEWLSRPFTTRDTIQCHERAFNYFGGMPEEIVYDQDHLISVSENAGDIILTGEFQTYKQERGFRLYLCRKSDPESKGQIENVVKFVKGNFGKHRVFTGIDEWNEKCLAWLERTGNYNVHNTTKKRPVEVHAVEKQHLRPVSSLLSFESNLGSSISATVYKDNVIKYKSNRYSVPLGTYRPKGENKVYIDILEEELIIRATLQGDVLAKHRISPGKGGLIKSRNHSRDRSKGIQAFKETVARQFKNQEKADSFINKVAAKYPRYIRDQLQVMQHTITNYRLVIEEALEVCIKDQLWSANDFRDIAIHLDRVEKSKSIEFPSQLEPLTKSHAFNAKAVVRDISQYTNIIGGVS